MNSLQKVAFQYALEAPTRETSQDLLEDHLDEQRRPPESARTRDLGAEQG
ncbi:hypothetical protein [Thioalkalivibrio sp. ALMg13-2]|nr:hypothetical protein [Thioalkalivibrio sp. ALMg13-2]